MSLKDALDRENTAWREYLEARIQRHRIEHGTQSQPPCDDAPFLPAEAAGSVDSDDYSERLS